MSEPKVGILFSVFDGDAKHFDRFLGELTRLGFPFAVNLDHCCAATKVRFAGHPLCCGSYTNDDPNHHFNEMHRQTALDVLYDWGTFDYALSMDVDETLEHGAHEKIRQMIALNADVVDVPVLDLWEDCYHMRVDGSFKDSHREKLIWLKSDAGKFQYYHPTINGPKILEPKRELRIVNRYPLRVLHWGIMDNADVQVHTDRWDGIFTRAVGGNPYKFYEYINDPLTVPLLTQVPPDVYGEPPCTPTSDPESSSASTRPSPATGG